MVVGCVDLAPSEWRRWKEGGGASRPVSDADGRRCECHREGGQQICVYVYVYIYIYIYTYALADHRLQGALQRPGGAPGRRRLRGS